jgi:paraquat-inducible protein A
MMAARRSAMPRWLLVRALIAASLMLLAVGAVAPLLTTERFYFFSNTFSLASALRQLVATDQSLLAIVIGLFSFCVPIVKAVVIWLAASGRASSRPLLTLAERFGKWSMLEVFVAALLITALKLGPVAGGTLHYGAYLLAGSVVLSGAASQLLPHEPSAGPLFSSPITLTAGAVGGAVSAALLIGVLNPDAVNLDALVGTPEARCIERTLELDRFYARTSDTQTEYVDRLRSIRAQGCPHAFATALEDYVAALSELDELDAAGEQAASWLERAGVRIGLLAARDDRLRDVEKTWAEIERVALAHRVKVPASQR